MELICRLQSPTERLADAIENGVDGLRQRIEALGGVLSARHILTSTCAS